MNKTLTDRWTAFSPREQRMLALMAVAILAFLYWFAALAPLKAWSGDARDRHALALAEASALPSFLEAIQSMPPAARTAAPDPAALADSARAIGLEVIGVESLGDQVQLTLAPSPPDRLFAWLEQQRLAGQGPRVARLESEAPGVRATLRF